MKAKKKKKGMYSYAGGGLAQMIKEYKQGGKMNAGLRALLAEAPELAKKFGVEDEVPKAGYGMKVKKK